MNALPQDDSSKSSHTLSPELIARDLTKSNDNGLAEGEDRAIEDDAQKQALINRAMKLNNKRAKQDIKLRRQYANRVYFFMTGFTIFVGCVVITAGFCPIFEIGDTPLSVLIGSAFASAVGLVAFVVKGLFPHACGVDDRKS